MADTGPASSSPSLIIKPVCVCSWVEFICLTSFVLWLECSIKCLLEYKCCWCCGQWFLPLTRSQSWFSIYNYHRGCQKRVALMAPVWLPRVFFFTGAEWKTSIKPDEAEFHHVHVNIWILWAVLWNAGGVQQPCSAPFLPTFSTFLFCICYWFSDTVP